MNPTDTQPAVNNPLPPIPPQPAIPPVPPVQPLPPIPPSPQTPPPPVTPTTLPNQQPVSPDLPLTTNIPQPTSNNQPQPSVPSPTPVPTPTQTPPAEAKKSGKGKKILIVILLFLLIGGITTAVVATLTKKPELIGIFKKNVLGASSEENTHLVSEVNKIILLPSDEIPSIADVTDPMTARNQEFFKNSQKGDKVLLFKNSKRAYLYRPSEKRIIEVGQFVVNAEEDSSAPSPEESLDLLNR